MTRNIKNPYAVAKCLRQRAVSTHSDAIGSIYKDFLISSKTGIFEDGLYCAGIIFQEVGTNLQMSADKTLYLCCKLKVGILTWTEETF